MSTPEPATNPQSCGYFAHLTRNVLRLLVDLRVAVSGICYDTGEEPASNPVRSKSGLPNPVNVAKCKDVERLMPRRRIRCIYSVSLYRFGTRRSSATWTEETTKGPTSARIADSSRLHR
jgi:hypothetical protein